MTQMDSDRRAEPARQLVLSRAQDGTQHGALVGALVRRG